VIGAFGFGGALTLARLFSGGDIAVFALEFTFSVTTVTVAAIATVATVALAILLSVAVLHLAVAVVWGSGAVAITAVVVTLAAIVLAGRVVSPASAGGDAAATGRAVADAGSATLTGSAGIEAPGCGRRSTSPLWIRRLEICNGHGPPRQTYLDLQQVIAADALVVHLMVRVVSIATALVFDECEASLR
jgi:hypothetical protein